MTLWSLREAWDYIPAEVRCTAYKNYTGLKDHTSKCRNDKELDIMHRRAAGETLQSIGDVHGMTREGVRLAIVRIMGRAEV
jgi:hypothetical protein